jgi:hypothetical protein
MIEQLCARGYKKRHEGDLLSSIKEYSDAIALDSSCFKAYFNRGFSYDKASDVAHVL